MKSCPSKKDITAYLNRAITETRQAEIKAHLLTCEKCQNRVEAAAATTISTPTQKQTQPTITIQSDTRPVQSDPSRPSGPMPGISGFPAAEAISQQHLEDLFEDYQILEELPRGGQAVVYKAIHKATKIKVALKVLLPSLLTSAKARRHFEREVELAAGLNHPNIVTIRDSGIARGQYYFAMEYVRGHALDDYVVVQKLDTRARVQLFAKICDAMTNAHQKGVIHRDLKPSNILVDERNEPRIVDFGLAKSAGSVGLTTDVNRMVSLTGEIKGTLSYMSPEQAEGRSDLVDVRSDVYSLGVILYQMLTGHFPYDVSGPPVKVLDNIQHAEPARPKTVVGRFDSDLEAILLKCLSKDPGQRYQSAAELHHDLNCWLDGRPIVAKSISSLYLLRKVMARHRYKTIVAASLIVIILSFASISYSQYRALKDSYTQMADYQRYYQGRSQQGVAMFKELALIRFLEAWHQEDSTEIQWGLGMLPPRSQERQAALYLLDANEPGAKSHPLPDAVEVPDWFADFLIGEHWLKRGAPERATQAYRNGAVKRKESSPKAYPLVRNLLEARLYQLRSIP